GSPANARRRWIAGRLKPAGRLQVDAGAVDALRGGASLLPAGVRGVSGEFDRGDAVEIIGPDRKVVAIGLAAYSAADVRAIAGKRSEDVANILGYARRPAVVEKSDLALKAE
ncbi:MAG: PUA domain-containing protein, partial [Pseudomonadota bacterium]